MYPPICLLNTLLCIIGFVTLLFSYRRSLNIFDTAKREKVTEILHYTPAKYKFIFLMKLSARIVVCGVTLLMDVGRLINGSIFLGTNDMYAWVALNFTLFIMGIIEYWSAKEYHQKIK